MIVAGWLIAAGSDHLSADGVPQKSHHHHLVAKERAATGLDLEAVPAGTS